MKTGLRIPQTLSRLFYVPLSFTSSTFRSRLFDSLQTLCYCCSIDNDKIHAHERNNINIQVRTNLLQFLLQRNRLIWEICWNSALDGQQICSGPRAFKLRKQRQYIFYYDLPCSCCYFRVTVANSLSDMECSKGRILQLVVLITALAYLADAPLHSDMSSHSYSYSNWSTNVLLRTFHQLLDQHWTYYYNFQSSSIE